MDCCRYCGIELEVGGNWLKSQAEKYNKTCRSCYSEYAKTHQNRNKNRMFVNGKHISTKHPLHKAGSYKTFSDAAFDGTYKLDSIKEGYVYAITNPAWPEWVKIGMAIDADDRCNGYQTSSPLRDYSLEHAVVSNNRRAAEADAHKAASKIAEEQRGEWFKISIEQAKDILNTLSVNLEKAA